MWDLRLFNYCARWLLFPLFIGGKVKLNPPRAFCLLNRNKYSKCYHSNCSRTCHHLSSLLLSTIPYNLIPLNKKEPVSQKDSLKKSSHENVNKKKLKNSLRFQFWQLTLSKACEVVQAPGVIMSRGVYENIRLFLPLTIPSDTGEQRDTHHRLTTMKIISLVCEPLTKEMTWHLFLNSFSIQCHTHFIL